MNQRVRTKRQELMSSWAFYKRICKSSGEDHLAPSIPLYQMAKKAIFAKCLKNQNMNQSEASQKYQSQTEPHPQGSLNSSEVSLRGSDDPSYTFPTIDELFQAIDPADSEKELLSKSMTARQTLPQNEEAIHSSFDHQMCS